MSVTFDVRCAYCGLAKTVEANHLPQFGFELSAAATRVGYPSYHDVRYNRILVFCTEGHATAARTRRGFFRRNPAIKAVK